MPQTLRRLAPCVFLVLFLAAPGARADTLKVPTEAFPTIQSAVNSAGDGDVIVVGKGVYREQLFLSSSGVTINGKKETKKQINHFQLKRKKYRLGSHRKKRQKKNPVKGKKKLA